MSTYSKITGIGMSVPKKVVTNDDLAKMVDTSDQWIVERTGIRERRIAEPEDQTSEMGTVAAREALERAGKVPADIDLIIVATTSPDYHIPPTACQIQHLLGAQRAGAFNIALGCTGFVAALITGHQFIASGAYKCVLVVGVELISRFIDWTDRDTCVLFGDGAGAVVLEATSEKRGVLGFTLGSDGSGGEHLIVPAGCTRQVLTQEAIAQGLHYVKMNGPEVFKFASRQMGKAALEAMEHAGITTKDIDLFVPHQANTRIIESSARALGIPPEKVFVNIEKYGNTSAASVPIALYEALAQKRAKEGDILSLVAFGAGLSWGSAVLRL